MKETRKKYSKEFKQKAVELSHVRGSAHEIAHELGIRAELLYHWRSELSEDPSMAFSSNENKQLTTEQKELADLRKELAFVKMENDILKETVSSFSVSDRKSTSS